MSGAREMMSWLRRFPILARSLFGPLIQAWHNEAGPADATLPDLLATLDLGAFLARDMDGRIRHWSGGCERLYGWTASEAVGQVTYDLLGTRFPVPFEEIEATLRRTGEWRGDLHHRTRDGHEIVVAAQKLLRRDAQGREHILELVTDVTAHRQAEEALRQSETTLSAVLAALPVGVMIADASGRIIRDNPANREIWGLPPDRASWEQYADWVGFWPQTGGRIQSGEWAMSRALRQGEVVRDELVECQPFGRQERRFYLNNAAPIRDVSGDIIGAVVAEMDVTERRLAEIKLADSEARLRTIVETVPVGLIMAELPSGRVLGGNSYVETMLRHPAPQFLDINSHDRWIAFHADGTRVRSSEYPLARMVLSEEENPSIEVLYERGDASRVWTRMMGRPVRDSGGKLVGGVLALLDIDGERRARDALEEVNRHLEERVLEEMAAREAAQKAARYAQHIQAIGQLAGGVAHEFNNILQAVQGGASLIANHVSDPQVVRRFTHIILRASQRGGVITDGLLSFAQKARFTIERIDPAVMLDALGEVLAHTLGAAVRVRVEHPPELPAIVADKLQLETALINLATNARDAMSDGGDLTISASAEIVTDARTVEEVKPGRYLRITITDTGVGMDAKTLAHAAQPFFTTKGPDRGTGLGLPMAKGFAEQSGGALAIESTPGKGTAVSIWLPVAAAAAEKPDSQAPVSGTATTTGRRVLLVEDDEMVREVLALSLEEAGYAVLTACDGVDALGLLQRGQVPDAVVADFSMPGMDGVALIHQIQALRPGLPAALLTGFAPTDARLVEAGMQPGAFPVLRKPITPPQLVAELKSLLAEAGC